MSKKRSKSSPSDQDVIFPPDTFNLSDRAFRPSTSFKAVEGLQETVQKLHGQGRYRSALDKIFEVLDEDPDNEHALRQAMIIVGESRTQQLQAQEPITPVYLHDRRLDPIFTVCSHCQATTWVSTNCLFGAYANSMTIMSPAGMQCYNCGYVVCRSCLDEIHLGRGIGIFSKSCPNCGQDTLNTPVYPTGRLPQRMARHPKPIVQIFVFREGPVPPDTAYMRQLLEIYSPDALEDEAELIGIPLFPWPDNIEAEAAVELVSWQIAHQKLKGRLDEGEYAHLRDEAGNRVYVAKLMMPSPQASEEATSYEARPDSLQVEDSKGPALLDKQEKSLIQHVVSFIKRLLSLFLQRRREIVSSLDELILDLIERHLKRLMQEFKNVPGLAVTKPHWKKLLQSDILQFTETTIAEELRKSLLDREHHWHSQQIDDLFLTISAIPALPITEARSYFRGGYLGFLDKQIQDARIEPNKLNIVHWVVCSDGNRIGIHLTFLPRVAKGITLFAQDMLTDAEKSQLGIS